MKAPLFKGPSLGTMLVGFHCMQNTESPIFEGFLIVPLDCEWIWHCHRLNPVRYQSDCEELNGKILDNSNVISSVQGICKKQTEEIWNKLYPNEPYDFDSTKTFLEDSSAKVSGPEKYTKYDLVSAVRRQSPFFYRLSRSHVNHDIFLEEAVARYKGFLHMIRRNQERSIRHFCVPTYDVDLIWHTHQLPPVSYSNDVSKVLGKVLEHDDILKERSLIPCFLELQSSGNRNLVQGIGKRVCIEVSPHLHSRLFPSHLTLSARR